MNRSFQARIPEVSVLMSCYNASRWLHEAVDSVLTQSFENFEFIMVDDGSTDETWNIIQSYRDRDERVVAMSKENTGLADSLNMCIAQARGAWIARLDADDICEPRRLEEQVTFVRNHPEVVLLGTGFVEIDEHGRAIKKHRYPSSHRNLVLHLERSQGFFPHSSAFFRTDVVKQVGGYNQRIRRAEDWWLWLELSLRGKIACLPRALVKVRKYSNHKSVDKLQLCEATAAIVCHVLQHKGYRDPSVDTSEDEWISFLSWIEHRIEESGIYERRGTWVEARAEYFATENRLISVFYLGTHLLKSGHAGSLVWEKLFGSALPQRLARKWMKRPSDTAGI